MWNMKQLEYGALARRANQIKDELRQGVRRPYKEVIDVFQGDLHRAGMKPLTFIRQVLAACVYPPLINSSNLPFDVRQRAQEELGRCVGGSVGSYSAVSGIPEIIHSISEFIKRRDGGIPSHPENIYISPGSQWSISNILNVLVNREASPRTGVLIPVPCHNKTVLSITQLGAVAVPYYLSEEQGWALQVEELQRALESAKGVCNPVSLYVINPGNPAGYVQSQKSVQEVIRFAWEKRLFLLVDEVEKLLSSSMQAYFKNQMHLYKGTYGCLHVALQLYQDCVYGENCEFVSYKRTLSEMGPPFSGTVELASFHSVSKGFSGECGLRAGYVELVNLDAAVMKYIHTLFSKDTCAPVLGQIALDLMTDPPKPGDPSYLLYKQEIEQIRTVLVHNVKKVHEVVNSLPGFSCPPIEGGLFAFPRLHLTPKAIQKAKELGLQPDTFYCTRLLEEGGVFTGPGWEYGQKEGTYHISFCIAVPQDVMEELLRRLSSFHMTFMKDFS
ncbi:alanine aminotransferase 1-like isoform X1 [Simochromis diagramma]|uniref:alanine aminotransferase 1-like isoform X1 n=1 Tax=Simochromis diagramma TaxID=43689 RepID=UPI001A7ED620|nr:alanine aminotransferase 1-like isoform X1 [Simochromis diagramma]